MLATTPSQTVGPYFRIGLCERPAAEVVSQGAPEAFQLRGRVLDGAGEPVSDALVEVWTADAEGRYRADFGWGRCGTDEQGRYAFSLAKPGRVPDSAGGLQAPHVSLLVFARGLLKPILTRMYVPDEDANREDRVLQAVDPDRRATLVAVPAAGELELDVRLQGERETVFFAV